MDVNELRERLIGIPGMASGLSVKISEALGELGAVKVETAAVVLEDYVKALKEDDIFRPEVYRIARLTISGRACTYHPDRYDELVEDSKKASLRSISAENEMRRIFDAADAERARKNAGE